MTLWQQAITILMCVFGTMLTRFLPFLVFSSKRPTPKYIQYLGQVLPGAIFAMSCRSPVEPCAICCSCRWCLCERRGALEIAPVPSPVIYAMIGYIYVICRYAELILKDVADCTGHFFIIIG